MDARFENASYAACAVVLAAFFGTHAFDARLERSIAALSAQIAGDFGEYSRFCRCVEAAERCLSIEVLKRGGAVAHARLRDMQASPNFQFLFSPVMDVTYARVLREMWEEKYGAGGGQQRAANGARQTYQGEAGDFHNTIPPATTMDYNDFESRMTAELHRRKPQ